MHKIDFDMDKTVHRRSWSLTGLEESVGCEGNCYLTGDFEEP